MGKIVCSLFAVAVSVASVPDVAAQIPLAVGDRVRVSAPDLAPDDIVGTVAGTREDTLVVTVPWRTQPVDVPFSSISSLDRAWGYQTRTVRGTLFGAGLGLLAGAIAFDDDGLGEGGMAVAGAIVGGVVGSRIRAERWRAAPRQTRWIVGASVRF